MEELGWKEKQSFSSGGTFKSQLEHKLDRESQETFFTNLELAIKEMASKHGMNSYTTASLNYAQNYSDIPKIQTRNIWILALALLLREKHGIEAMKAATKLRVDNAIMVDVIRYLRFLAA